MATPEDLERRFTLLSAVARYDVLRTRDALASPAEEDDPESLSIDQDMRPLTREETLELLALGEVIARKAGHGRQLTVRSARRAGASWSQIGAALGTTKQAAWETHNRWIDEQARQHRDEGHWGWEGDEVTAARTLAGEPETEEPEAKKAEAGEPEAEGAAG